MRDNMFNDTEPVPSAYKGWSDCQDAWGNDSLVDFPHKVMNTGIRFYMGPYLVNLFVSEWRDLVAIKIMCVQIIQLVKFMRP